MQQSENKNEGKDQWGLLLKDLPYAMNAMLKVRQMGCEKYARDNWAQSIGTEHGDKFLEDNLESMQRHIIEMFRGNNLDDESGEPNAAHLMIRAAFAIEYFYRHHCTKTSDS